MIINLICLLFSLSCAESSNSSDIARIPNTYQILTFLNTHNYYRSSVNPPAYLPSMSWKYSLAISSNTWASKCIWGHSGTPNVGENIYATSLRTSASDFDPSNAVNAWGSEKIYYNYATNTCAAGKVCGHYTQIIWKSSTGLGCAFQDCPVIQGLPWPNGGTIVVCQYSPPGNWYGQRPY